MGMCWTRLSLKALLNIQSLSNPSGTTVDLGGLPLSGNSFWPTWSLVEVVRKCFLNWTETSTENHMWYLKPELKASGYGRKKKGWADRRRQKKEWSGLENRSVIESWEGSRGQLEVYNCGERGKWTGGKVPALPMQTWSLNAEIQSSGCTALKETRRNRAREREMK